jgi:hypothetical protein
LDTGSFSKEAKCNLSPLLARGVFWIVRATMHAFTGVGDLVAVIRRRFINCKRNRDWRIYTVLKGEVLPTLPCSK